jgi:hypothetical protein
MAKKTLKKAPKKAAKKPAKKAAKKKPSRPSGARELRAFKAAVLNLKKTGAALARVTRKDDVFRASESVQLAVESAQTVSGDIAIAIPVGPPHTTVFN